MHTSPSTYQPQEGSLSSYIIGFVLSVVLTLAAYFLVVRHILTGDFLIAAIFAIAIAQLIVQLIFFLHLDKASGKRWNLVAMLFAILVVLIFVGGTLWVMTHLNADMTPAQMNSYINSQDGL